MSKSKVHNLQIRLEQFIDQIKKIKDTNYLELHFSKMAILKTLIHKSGLNLGTCHKNVVQFTERNPTIDLNAKRKKLTFSNMPVINTIQ